MVTLAVTYTANLTTYTTNLTTYTANITTYTETLTTYIAKVPNYAVNIHFETDIILSFLFMYVILSINKLFSFFTINLQRRMPLGRLVIAVSLLMFSGIEHFVPR